MINAFWDQWPGKQKTAYLFSLAVFSSLIVYYLIAAYRGEYNTLEWLITSTMDTIKVPVKVVSVGLFDLELNIDNYLITQHYEGSVHQITPLSGYIFLAVIVVSLISLFTISTYLKRFWYLISMTGLSFAVVNFRFEQLEIFGWIDNTFLLITLALLLPASYYLQSFNNNKSFAFRFLTFSAIFLSLATVIAIFSEKALPFYFLVSYNYATPVILSIVFIVLVSHEVVYFILYVVTGSGLGKGGNPTGHFIALSLIYLANVILIYLRNASIIDWDILYINAFYLLAVSGVLGIWGFKQREIVYNYLLDFKPLGAILYVTLGVICFSTITYHTITNNDPVLETFEDAIIFTHIGFGIMFMLYILSNFINLISKGLAVYKVAFKEDNMPYFSMNLGGLVIAAGLFYLSGQAAFQQAFAGYYNGLGSVYTYDQDLFLAEEYYKRGSIFGYQNHRSNYSIGELAVVQGDESKAIDRFSRATKKNPTEFSYINLANNQSDNGFFFEALFSLREGSAKFPDSDKIKNNLGLLFRKTQMLDSAILYMESGAEGIWGSKTNQTNIIDILAENRIRLRYDSLVDLYQSSDHLPIKSNLLAYSNATGNWLPVDQIGDLSGRTLDIHQFAYTFNLLTKKSSKTDSITINYLQQLIDNPGNQSIQSELTLLKAIHLYNSGNVTEAFRTIDPLQNNPDVKGYINHIMGVMAIDQKAPRLASDFFRKALREQYSGARVNLAIALSEAGQTNESLSLWGSIYSSDSLNAAGEVITAQSLPSEALVLAPSEVIKYHALRYRRDLDAITLVNSIDNSQLKISALRSMFESAVRTGDVSVAESCIELLETFKTEYNLETILMNFREKLELLKVITNESDISQSSLDQHKLFWAQPEDALAQEFFKKKGFDNPFEELEVLLASQFYHQQLQDLDTSYRMLLNAIELNPYSVSLLKEYILAAIANGLDAYAESELKKLEGLITPQELSEFQENIKEAQEAYNDFSFPVN